MRAVVCAVLMVGTAARADDAPQPIAPWILPHDGIRIDTTAELEMSNAKVGKPFDLAPDLWFAPSDDLTLGFTESRYAASGFRGAAGSALCLTGTTGGCPSVYNNFGIEGWLAAVRGPFSLVVGGGPYAVNIERGFYSLKLGVKARVRAGRLSVSSMPSVFITASGRDAMPPANRDMLYVPVAVAVKLTDAATVSVGSGVKAPLAGIATEWQVPVGVSATYAIGPVVVGASFTFGALFTAASNPAPPAPPVEGTDLRVVQIWLSYSSAGPKKRAPTADAARDPVAVAHPPPPAATPARRHEAPHPTPPPRVSERERERDPEPEPVVANAAAGSDIERVPDDTVTAVAGLHGGDVSSCRGAAELSGEVSISFEVDAMGNVGSTAVTSTIQHAVVSDCVLHAVRGWQFPKPASGHARGVYTITFR